MGVMLSPKLREVQKGMLAHWCPGCKELHMVYVAGFEHPGPIWGYDFKHDCPTFTPSLKHSTNRPRTIGEMTKPVTYTQCHYFIKNGQIQYLSDCIHPLAGQTVDLPDIPQWNKNK